MTRQGQAALEFITTYGWALVVLLLAIGALTYFGIFDAITPAQNKCDMWPEFNCEESQVTEEGKVRLVIRNNLPNLESINVTLDTQSCELENDSYVQGSTRNTQILNDSLITFSCITPLNEGDLFIADIVVKYVGQELAIEKIAQGNLRQTIQ